MDHHTRSSSDPTISKCDPVLSYTLFLQDPLQYLTTHTQKAQLVFLKVNFWKRSAVITPRWKTLRQRWLSDVVLNVPLVRWRHPGSAWLDMLTPGVDTDPPQLQRKTPLRLRSRRPLIFLHSALFEAHRNTWSSLWQMVVIRWLDAIKMHRVRHL
jgi:hypothetical protein